MKNLYIIICVSCLCIYTSFAQSTPKPQLPKGHQLYKSLKLADQKRQVKDRVNPFKTGDRATDRIYYEFDRTCDPAIREIPENIHIKEQKFIKSKKSLAFDNTASKSSSENWVNRGPYNVGGRTRALAIDMTNENVILAGGVSGGMWRSESGGVNWRKVTSNFQNPSISTIAQDPRPGHQDTWYYGGGERIGNSASLNAAGLYAGNGIYKSQDGGRTWELLNATVDNNINRISPFDLVNKIAVHPVTGDVYAATMNGIYRSQNGGNSFEEVLATGPDHITEITIAATGKIYASAGINFATASVGAFAGIYSSDNGENWLNISLDEGVYPQDKIDRAIIAVNPIDDQEFFVLGNFKNVGTPRLYRYRENDNQKWKNLSDKLPAIRDNRPVGGLNLQTGYNIILEIHPQDPNFIIFGGTNLFRTTDGFATKVQDNANHWIGGYSPKNDVSLYPDQHPDMHACVFYPSNPNRVLNANDGGVFRTENIRESTSFEEPVDWVSLNNGYITTQPYAISFDPETESKELLAGFQDNGTWYTNKNNTKNPWIEELGGDGSYNAIADKGRTRYSSSQFANILRINYDTNNNPISYARIQPPVGGFSFINPFVLDPNDDNVMYLPAGRFLLRNSNLDAIPTFTDINGPIPTLSGINWSEIAEVASIPNAAGNRELNPITALDVSKFPIPDRVYYGTGQGQLFRLDYANISSSEPIDIFTDKGFPENGFISSVQVDPNNSDNVVIAFSNYNVKSVFLTKDAGETWIDISGNLEENRDGTGNGPSVRSVSFLGNGNGLLAGTSTGLYYAKRTLGNNTVWGLENQEIGNGVVMQAKTRKDGFAALAVHGNGVFSKKFRVSSPSGPITLFVNEQPDDQEFFVDEVPEVLQIDLKNVFRSDEVNPNIVLLVENTNLDLIDVEVISNQFLNIRFKKTDLNIPDYDKEGIATIRIIATSGSQKKATEFTVNTVQRPIFSQFDPEKDLNIRGVPSMEGFDNDFPEFREFSELADQIIIPTGEKWTLERIQVLGVNAFAFDPNEIPVGDTGILRIYKNDDGEPGDLVTEVSNVLRTNPFLDGLYDLILPEPLELSEGAHWLVWVRNGFNIFLNSIYQVTQDFLPDDPDYEIIGEDVYTRGTGEGINGEPETWFPYSENILDDDTKKVQTVFFLYGEINNNNQSVKENNLSQEIGEIYPNPITNSLTIDLRNDPLEKHNATMNFITITDVSGKEIYNMSTKEIKITIDSSSWNTGVYVVRVRGANTIERTSKIIRL